MCGLVGLITKHRSGISKKQGEVFGALLYIDYLRGQDSTGVFMIDNRGDILIAKEASGANDFMASKEFGSLMNAADKRGAALIGHNRKATRGDISDENAHPFWVEDKIVLVHNGTMYGEHKKLADVEVDSHAIAHVLSENDNIEDALKTVNAAYALIWYDVQQKKLHAIRNSQRPLYWVETASEWIISSEKEMIDFVVGRYDLKPQKGPTIFSVDDLQMWSLTSSGWNATYRTLNLEHNHSDANELQNWQRDFRNIVMGGDEYDDVPFSDGVVASPLPLPRSARRQNITERLHGDGLIQVETNKHSLNILTEDYERNLARNTNKCVPNAQFYSSVAERFPRGSKVTAYAFEYVYANFHDADMGFYLYLQVWDDPDVICRVFFDSKAKDRMDNMAGTSYVYEVEVNRKWWGSFAKLDTPQATTPGYVIMECTTPRLIYGGGMGDPEWGKKITQQLVKH